MGLFSRFQSGRAPARPAGETWVGALFKAEAVSHEACIVHVPGRTPVILPAFAVDFAIGCREFQSLSMHVAEYAEKHHWDSHEVAGLERLLPRLDEAGVLVSSTTITARLGTMHGSAGTISALGTPTGGARHALVERALRSFAANFRTNGRTPDLLVADSSADPEQTCTLRERLRALGLELPIWFAGASEKGAFGAHLVQRGACSPATAEFALMDPHGTGFVCGGNRNTLLLHEAGRMLASVDDDVVCRLARSPKGPRSGWGLFSGNDIFGRSPYESREAVLAATREEEGDFLGSHEALVGRGPGDLALETLSLELAGGRIARRVLEQDCRIRATFNGHYGDPGIPTSAYYLYYQGENRERLWSSAERYRSFLASRAAASFVPTPMLGDGSSAPGIAMALDHRELLPPFFPVLHAEDYSFGAALWQSCPDAILGHTPWGVLHDAVPGKGILLPREIGPGRRAATFEFAHLLRGLLFRVKLPSTATAEVRMCKLGRAMEELGQMAPGDFRDAIVAATVAEACYRIQHLSEQLEETPEAPDFWRADVEHLLAQITASLEDETMDIPLDLQTGRSPAAARVLMQRLIGSYGELLQAWPAMVQAAVELRADGITLMQPVQA